MFIVDFNLLNWTDSETNKIRVTWSGLSTWLSGIKQKQHNSSCTDFTIGLARKKRSEGKAVKCFIVLLLHQPNLLLYKRST
jgi:hypothetical protein